MTMSRAGKPRKDLEKMDCCNICLTGLPASTFVSFQSVINTSTREILLKLNSDPVTHGLCNGFTSHSEQKPKSLQLLTRPSTIICLTIPQPLHLLLLCLAHSSPVPVASLLSLNKLAMFPPQDLGTSYSFCLELSFLGICTVCSITSFKFLLKCALLREVFLGYSICNCFFPLLSLVEM